MNLTDTLPISRYRVTFQAVTPIRLPPYAGSALRGAFGHALKAVACLSAARHRGECRCAVTSPCLYRQLFEPFAVQFVPDASLQADKLPERLERPPPPLIIEPVTQGVDLATGDQGTFHLVVFGRAAHLQLPVIQLAWQHALMRGIGMQNEAGLRGQATLTEFALLDQPADCINPSDTMHLHLLTPTRLQRLGQWVSPDDLTASTLLWAVIWRQRLMVRLYGDPATLAPLPETLAHEFGAVTLQQRLVWHHWTRYSNRQKQTMSLGGLCGHLLLGGLSDALSRDLYYGQWLHVGKNSLFGLGQYIWTLTPWDEYLKLASVELTD